MWGMGQVNFGFWICDFGLESKIQNLKSKILTGMGHGVWKRELVNIAYLTPWLQKCDRLFPHCNFLAVFVHNTYTLWVLPDYPTG
jgi:hypothetical protein